MKERIKKSWEVIQHGQGFWGLLPAPFASLIVTWLAYLAGYSAFALLFIFLISLGVVEFILWRAKTKGRRALYISLLAAALLIASAWAMKQNNDKRDAYGLSFEGITVLRDGRTTPDGEGLVTGVNVQIDIANKNSFDLWYIVRRQYAKFGNDASSLKNAGAKVQKLESQRGLYLANDLVRKYFQNGQYHDGEVEFIVDYGRDPGKLDRRFTFTSDVRFFLCPKSGLLCGDVTMENDETRNERIREAPVAT